MERLVVMPEASIRRYWDALMFVVIFYNCNMTPILVATPPRLDSLRSKLRTVDLVLDLLFVVDTFSGFVFAFVDKDTKEVVTNVKAIRDSYLASARLKLNVLAMTPLLTLPNSVNKRVLKHGLCKALYDGPGKKRCMKVARLTRMSRIFMFFSQLAAVRAVLEKTGLLVLNEAGFRMTQIIVSYVFLASFCGSLYFYLACNDASPVDAPYCVYGSARATPSGARRKRPDKWPSTWVESDVVFRRGESSWTAVVARCMYFMVQTLFTIGYGDSVAPVSMHEIKFTLVLMNIGALTYALVIANMTSMLANANVLHGRHAEEVLTVAGLMDARDLPDGLKARVKQCFDYLWCKQGGMLERALLAEMPPTLREQVVTAQVDLLRAVPFFKRDASSNLAVAAAFALESRVYVPNTTIVYAHEKHRELLVVRHGRVLLFSTQSPMPVATLDPGDFLGDLQLVLDARHPVAARTGPLFVEALVLTRAAFDRVCASCGVAVSETDVGVVATLAAYGSRLAEWRFRAKNMAADVENVGGVLAAANPVTQTQGGLKRSDSNLADDDGTEDPTKMRFLIFPDDRVHCFWEPTLLLVGCWSLIMIPVRTLLYANGYWGCGFKRDPSLWIDVCVDALFLFDVYLRCFHVAYQRIGANNEDSVIVDRKEIFAHYASLMRSKVELVAAFPWIVLLAPFNPSCAWHAAMRYPHLVRVYVLSLHLDDVRDFLELHGRKLSDRVVTAARLTAAAILLIVFMACYWAILRGDHHQSFASAFFRAIYFAIVTLTTVGYGDVTPETVSETWFMVVAAAVGATFFAGVVANITSMVHTVDVSESNISHQRVVMETFMRECGVASTTNRKVMAYFDFVETDKAGLDDKKLLDKYLPPNVRDDVLLYFTHRMVLACKVFRGTEAGFLRLVMLALDQHFYMRGQTVVVQNEPAYGMFFIAKGEVEVLVNNVQASTLSTNMAFAEDAVLSDVDKMPYTVHCLGYNEHWYLARADFLALLPQFPQVQAKVPEMRRRVRRFQKAQADEQSEPTNERPPLLKDASSMGSSRGTFEVTQTAPNQLLASGFVHPDSTVMKVWNAVLLFFIVWNMVWVPFKACYLAGYRVKKSMIVLMCFDYVGDIVFFLDIVLRSRHLVYLEAGDVPVASRRKIFKRYKKSGELRNHVVASLPLEFIFLVVRPPFDKLSSVQYLAVLRANRLARFLDIGSLVEKCENGLGFKTNKNALRLVRLVAAILLSSHFFGALFFAIANARGGVQHCHRYSKGLASKYCANWAQGLLDVTFHNTTNSTGGEWVAKRDHVEYDLGKARFVWKQYVAATYWGAATITTVGYGDISANSLSEVLFSIICLILSVGVYTLIVANLEDIVGNLDVTTTLNNQRREQVTQYCRRSYLPELLQQSINDYYDKLWAVQKGASGTAILKMLPSNVRVDLVMELAGTMLENLTFVKVHPRLLHDLALALELDLYMPEDYLFKTGECAWRLFLMSNGTGALVDDSTGLVVDSIESPSVIGEAEFFLRIIYPVSAKITDHSQIFGLAFDALVHVVARYSLLDAFRDGLLESENDLNLITLESTVTASPSLRGPSMKGLRQSSFASSKGSNVDQRDLPMLTKKSTLGRLDSQDALSSLSATSIRSGFDTLAHGGVLEPNSVLKRVWHVVCLGAVLYILVSVPYEIGFARQYAKRVFVMDIVFLGLSALDIALNLTRFAVRSQGQVITDPVVFRAMYVETYLLGDVLGLLPLSLLVAASLPSRFTSYSPWLNILRLVHVVRLKHVAKYLESLRGLIKDQLKLNVSGDLVYLTLLLAINIILCHWLACGFYVLGRYELSHASRGSHSKLLSFNRIFKNEDVGCAKYEGHNVWICTNDATRGPATERWLKAFYWALYTCSTIGYGAISVESIAEKVLSVVAMIVGAMVCDAGITAVLTAFIEHRDHQAGSNKRRSVCAKKLLAASSVPDDVQRSVFAFFDYCDLELANLEEQAVLNELNTALRNRILQRAAHTKLCDSLTFGGHEAGVVATMASEMRSVVAVPSQRILQIGQPDPDLYVFQSGVAHSVDAAGDHEYIATGTILSNVEYKQVAKRVGMPTTRLLIRVVAARGLPRRAGGLHRLLFGTSVCSPYVEVVVVSKTVFGQSVKTCQTNVRKHTTRPVFDETFVVKAYQNTDTATVNVLHWRRGLAGVKLGSCDIAVKAPENSGVAKWHSVFSDAGKKVGEVRIFCEFKALEKSSIAPTAELTVIADTFCHLYVLDFASQEKVRKYVKGVRLPFKRRLLQSTDSVNTAKSSYQPAPSVFENLRKDDDDDDFALGEDVNPNARGFEAYMSETFAKRATKGSVMQVVEPGRRTSTTRRNSSFSGQALPRKVSNPGKRPTLVGQQPQIPTKGGGGRKVHPS